MAKLYILAVRDRAVSAFGRPFFVPALGGGIRSFSDEVNRADKDNQLYNHTDDFDMYHIGMFEEETGIITPITPEQICIGKNVKIQQ